MTYAVHHVDAEGRTQLEDVVSLEEALARVEDLRNDGGVSEVRVLKEVPIEVRTYYRVVAVAEAAADAQAPEPPVATVAEVVAEDLPPVEVAASPVEDPAPEPEPVRAAAVFGEAPSGAVVMGPPPAAAAPEPVEAPSEPAHEPRRALFGRS